MPVTDSFKKHEQNIFVDSEDANVKTKENLSAKNKAKVSTLDLKNSYVHVCTSVVRPSLKEEKQLSMC